MIEMFAAIKNGPTYYAGANVQCTIIFKNVTANSNSEYIENLGWASVQLVCTCVVDPLKVGGIAIPTKYKTSKTSSTALSPGRGEKGSLIFSSKPKIVVCDLSLHPNQSASFMYEEMIPNDLPPSFQGQIVKYFYKLKIGVQRIGSAIKMFQIPLHFVSFPNIHPQAQNKILRYNPFQRSDNKNVSTVEDALEALQQNMGSKKMPNIYKITNSRGRVVNLSLFKTSFRLGDDIIGILDFSDSVVQCVQFSVTLQSQEVLSQETGSGNSSREGYITSHSKCHEFCVGLLQTHLSLPIPLHLTPTFNTDLVSLKWRLHFEFVTTNNSTLWKNDSSWKPASSIDVETMIWDMPIVLYPTSPAHISTSFSSQKEVVALI